MANSHGGTRPGAGKPKGRKHAKTLAIEAAVRADRTLTVQALLEQMRRGACYDVRRLFDKRGNFRPIHRLSAEEAAMIAGFDIVKRNITAGDGKVDTILKVRLVDRAKYVEMGGRHHALFKDVVQVENVTEELLARLDRGRQRNAKPKKE